MSILRDLCKVAIATPGTGTITFGAAASAAYFTPGEVGLIDGNVVSYLLAEGNDRELGVGTIGGGGTTMTRTVLQSKIGGVASSATKMNLAGSATLSIVSASADFLSFGEDQTRTTTEKIQALKNLGFPTLSSDNAAMRFDGTNGRVPQASDLLIADTTADLSKVGGGGIDIEATNTNDSAPAGYKGAMLDATLAQGSAINLPTSTETHVLTRSFDPGHWIIFASPVIVGNGLTGVTDLIASLMTSPTPGSWSFLDPANPIYRQIHASMNVGTTSLVLPMLIARAQLSAVTTYRLMLRVSFTGGTAAGHGFIWGFRLR